MADQFSQSFTGSRATDPDRNALVSALRALDASANLTILSPLLFRVAKDTPWTPAQIAAVQTRLDTAAAATAETLAQDEIDAWPLALRALVLALIDQLNVIRAALPVPLPAITPAQALAAIRTKAGTL